MSRREIRGSWMRGVGFVAGSALAMVYFCSHLLSCGQGAAKASPLDGGTGGQGDAGREVDATAPIDAAIDAGAPDEDARVGDAGSLDAPHPVPDASSLDASRDGGYAALGRGVSGWAYVSDDALAAELSSYDTAVQSKSDGVNRRLRYLFPYGGGVSISGAALGSESLSYDPAASAFYASRLPQAAMIPIIDSGDGVNLSQWSAADQQALAAEVAKPILADPNAAGVQVDIEPFNSAQGPFYAKLHALLSAGGKIVTVFTGSTGGAIYANVDVVVLSGYDLGISPVTAANYTTTLSRMVATALASAADAGSYLMVGIPAAASYEEYESMSGTCDGGTGVTQAEWLAAAWKAVCPHYADSRYLGLAFWRIATDPLAVPSGSSCLRNPGPIPDASWGVLEGFDPSSCP